MLGRKLFRTVRPYFSAAAVIVTAVLLVFTIYFTQAKPQWTVFLTGILVAAILAEVTRATRAEWRVLRRTSQLSSLKDKLDRETLLRKNAEAKMAADKPRLLLLDEEMLTMIVMVDADGNCRYHNRAFREWQRLRPEQIDGHPLSKVLGVKVYEEIEPYIRKSMNGEKAHYNRKQGMKDGAVYNLRVKHLPTFGEGGKVTGFYILADDITERRDVLALPAEESFLAEHQLNLEAPTAVLNDDKGNQDLFIDSMSE
ncbi:MAG: PAS domain-containing protein, partial [Gallionellaceae bacterium]